MTKRRMLIQIRVTAKEKRAIRLAAKEVQFSISEWLRSRAFHNGVVNPANNPHLPHGWKKGDDNNLEPVREHWAAQ